MRIRGLILLSVLLVSTSIEAGSEPISELSGLDRTLLEQRGMIRSLFEQLRPGASSQGFTFDSAHAILIHKIRLQGLDHATALTDVIQRTSRILVPICTPPGCEMTAEFRRLGGSKFEFISIGRRIPILPTTKDGKIAAYVEFSELPLEAAWMDEAHLVPLRGSDLKKLRDRFGEESLDLEKLRKMADEHLN